MPQIKDDVRSSRLLDINIPLKNSGSQIIKAPKKLKDMNPAFVKQSSQVSHKNLENAVYVTTDGAKFKLPKDSGQIRKIVKYTEPKISDKENMPNENFHKNKKSGKETEKKEAEKKLLQILRRNSDEQRKLKKHRLGLKRRISVRSIGVLAKPVEKLSSERLKNNSNSNQNGYRTLNAFRVKKTKRKCKTVDSQTDDIRESPSKSTSVQTDYSNLNFIFDSNKPRICIMCKQKYCDISSSTSNIEDHYDVSDDKKNYANNFTRRTTMENEFDKNNNKNSNTNTSSTMIIRANGDDFYETKKTILPDNKSQFSKISRSNSKDQMNYENYVKTSNDNGDGNENISRPKMNFIKEDGILDCCNKKLESNINLNRIPGRRYSAENSINYCKKDCSDDSIEPSSQSSSNTQSTITTINCVKTNKNFLTSLFYTIQNLSCMIFCDYQHCHPHRSHHKHRRHHHSKIRGDGDTIDNCSVSDHNGSCIIRSILFHLPLFTLVIALLWLGYSVFKIAISDELAQIGIRYVHGLPFVFTERKQISRLDNALKLLNNLLIGVKNIFLG